LLITNANIYRTKTRDFVPGDILVEEGRISAVTMAESAAERVPLTPGGGVSVYDAAGRQVIPGLVDVHTHGRAGGDFASADTDTLMAMSESYLLSGVTTLLPTLASAPLEDLHTAIRRIGAVAATEGQHPGRMAHFAGVHLEGRYLNPTKRGAHAPELLAPLDAGELAGLLEEIAGARHVTAALELDGDGSFLARALSLGATVGLGHTAATYAQAMDALSRGATAMTHLFNAMPPLHHREGGAVCAGLLSPEVSCELICDGFHIAPEMVALAARMKGERLVLITDSMEATGCADGEYTIAGMPVTVKDGKARTHDGAIAGSTLSLFDGVKNLCAFAGIPFGEAVYAATMAPALEVGLEGEVGSLDVGKRADLLILDRAGQAVEQVICGGVCCTGAQ
jgi:N-acetylglucosamine-6-phosphate deacetylase